MNHPLRCRCGTLRGQVGHPEKVSRGVCYCKDCQAFAHFLGTTGDILDESGGTDVGATLPRHVSFMPLSTVVSIVKFMGTPIVTPKVLTPVSGRG